MLVTLIAAVSLLVLYFALDLGLHVCENAARKIPAPLKPRKKCSEDCDDCGCYVIDEEDL